MLSVFDVHDCVTRHVHHMEIQRQLIREAMTARGGSGWGSSTVSASDLGSTVLRSARRMKQDMDEEAAMKEAMRQRALQGPV